MTMKASNLIRFFIVIVIVHITTYLFAGYFANQIFYKGLLHDASNIMAVYMRPENDPALWRHAMRWLFPGQLLRCLLFTIALLPFYKTLIDFSLRMRVLALFGVFCIFVNIASNAADPACIEGLIYVRPEFVKAVFWKAQPEYIIQSGLFALAVGMFMPLQTTFQESRRNLSWISSSIHSALASIAGMIGFCCAGLLAVRITGNAPSTTNLQTKWRNFTNYTAHLSIKGLFLQTQRRG